MVGPQLTTWILALGLAAVPASLTWRGSPALAAPADRPADSARIERGAYLVRIMGCNHCHTPWKMGPHGPEPDMTRALTGHPGDLQMPPATPGAGPWLWSGAATNTAFAGPWGVSFSANLTPGYAVAAIHEHDSE